MKKYLQISGIVAVFIGMLMVINSAYASPTGGYSVTANLPDNQIDERLTYFDLKMEPGQIQALSLTVQNTSSEAIELLIEPTTATTNSQGVIDYTPREIGQDTSLSHAFSDLISEAQQVRVEANEAKIVTFTLTMPEETFDGIVLGGFHISEVVEEEAEQTEFIQNRFAFVIGAQLRLTEVEVAPDLALNAIQSTLINYRTAVTANLQNTEATILGNLDVTAHVRKAGQEDVLHETSRTGLAMAPNSNFDFPISWNNTPLEAGQYHLSLTATNGEQVWEFERDFEIEAEAAMELNREAVELVELEEDRTLLYVGLSVLLTAGVMGLIIWGMNKRKKRKEEKSHEVEKK